MIKKTTLFYLINLSFSSLGTHQLPKLEKTWQIFNRLETAIDSPEDFLILTRNNPQIGLNPLEGQDPLMLFWQDTFCLIAKIIKPKTYELSLQEKQIFMEQLDISKEKQSGFFTGFGLCFLRKVAIAAIKKQRKPEELQQLIQTINEFLLAQGFTSPIIPVELNLETDKTNKNSPSKEQCQQLTKQLFEEFYAIHHYCLAWQMSEHHTDVEIAEIAAKNQQINSLRQINLELEALNFNLEKERKLFEQDQIKHQRAKEQQQQRLAELAVSEHELELQYRKNNLEHLQSLNKVDLAKAQNAQFVEQQKALATNEHYCKLLSLERQKLDLEVQYQTLGLFEKTVQRFAECLSAVNQMKK